MTRVALACGEPIRQRMGGIGVRYLEFARRLPAFGLEVVLLTMGRASDAPLDGDDGVAVRELGPGQVDACLRDCDAVVAQGGAADLVVSARPAMPVAIDLYDPWLVENLAYADSLGPRVFERDLASWRRQLAAGDFFLCSCEAQRTFYLGLLMALGRVTPAHLARDPSLRRLIAEVPFGVPDALPPHRPLLPVRRALERRLLFGGIYDWLDPWPVLRALDRLDRPDWTLIVVANPNPATTPQDVWRQVEAWSRERGWWGTRVQAIDWVDADRRFDLFRDVDALVVSHGDTLETQLSFRTRVLDALAAGCPVVATAGGGMSDRLSVYGAGLVVPPDDADAMADALTAAIERPDPAMAARAAVLRDTFAWSRVLAPLAAFCAAPATDPLKAMRAAGTKSAMARFRDALGRRPAGDRGGNA